MKNSKDEEKVLVIETKKFFPNGIWEGFREESTSGVLDLINKNKQFIRRGAVEEDENYQQVIPQIVLKVGSRIFIHRIPATGGEKRLHDQWPIFLGGHINETDLDIKKASEREFREEINYKGKIISKKFLGVVKRHDYPVNKVHIGLVWLFEGDSENFESTEDEGITDGKFIEIKNLNDYLGKMTYWSELVAKFIIKKFSS